MTICVINGPNLNMLGIREPSIYGDGSYEDLTRLIEDHCKLRGVKCDIFQSNHEGEIIDKIQACLGKADAIVINPAAYTHTSVAILDALKAVNLPSVEVHISNTSSREEFRHISYAGLACERTFAGEGFKGYLSAIDYIIEHYADGRGEKNI